MNDDSPSSATGGVLRPWHVGIAAALSVAAAGYFAGTRPPLPRDPRRALPSASTTERAPSYAELRATRRGPNAAMYAHAFEPLEQDAAAPSVPPLQNEADRLRALAEQRARRAYDGAPPTIPHAIDPRALPDCLACHERGARMAGRIAPRMKHDVRVSCTQCHVPAGDPRTARAAP